MLLGVLFNAEGTFFQWETHRDMLRQVSVYGILACGMTLVIIAGGIDLSVGSILGFCAVVFSLCLLHAGMPAFVALCVTVIAGTGCGALAGVAIARFRIQPFIATLASMVFVRGLAKTVSGGEKVTTALQLPDGTYTYLDEPAMFSTVSSRVLGDNLAVVTIIMIACALLCWILLAKTRAGRYLYAIGGNEEAARLSGVPVARIKLAAYALSGFLCAIAGICQAAQEVQGDPEAGATYELSAIAIVVIGGTSLRGGTGSIGLTMVGVLTIGYLEKILSINAVSEASRLILTGLIIVGAVLLQQRRR